MQCGGWGPRLREVHGRAEDAASGRRGGRLPRVARLRALLLRRRRRLGRRCCRRGAIGSSLAYRLALLLHCRRLVRR